MAPSKIVDNLDKLQECILQESRARKLEFDKKYNKAIYQRFRDGGSIPFDEMAGFTPGHTVDFPSINESIIKTTRVMTGDKDTLEFITSFEKGAILKRHQHDDCDEYLTVPSDCSGMFLILSGREQDGTLMYTVLTAGDDEMLIPKGVVHQVSNISRKDCKLHVRFVRNDK